MSAFMWGACLSHSYVFNGILCNTHRRYASKYVKQNPWKNLDFKKSVKVKFRRENDLKKRKNSMIKTEYRYRRIIYK